MVPECAGGTGCIKKLLAQRGFALELDDSRQAMEIVRTIAASPGKCAGCVQAKFELLIELEEPDPSIPTHALLLSACADVASLVATISALTPA